MFDSIEKQNVMSRLHHREDHLDLYSSVFMQKEEEDVIHKCMCFANIA